MPMVKPAGLSSEVGVEEREREGEERGGEGRRGEERGREGRREEERGGEGRRGGHHMQKEDSFL